MHNNKVIYKQLNKDHAFWIEKYQVAHLEAGHTSGILIHWENRKIIKQLLFDVGIGTLDALCRNQVIDWLAPLEIFITHYDADHHIELSFLAKMWHMRTAKKKEVRFASLL